MFDIYPLKEHISHNLTSNIETSWGNGKVVNDVGDLNDNIMIKWTGREITISERFAMSYSLVYWEHNIYRFRNINLEFKKEFNLHFLVSPISHDKTKYQATIVRNDQ